jgi:hypothetical protein
MLLQPSVKTQCIPGNARRQPIADSARSAVAPDGTMHRDQSVPSWMKPTAVTSLIADPDVGPCP